MPSFATDPALALYVLAIGLGARHAIDPDHLTIIDGFTRRNIQRRPLVAYLSGVLFSLGHGMVVQAGAAAATMIEGGLRLPLWLETAGMLISSVVLFSLGALNLRAAWRTPAEQAVRLVGWKAGIVGRGGDHPLAIVGVGMLLALSLDTLAQAALIGAAAARLDMPGSVAALAAAYALGMLVVGGANGVWIATLARSAGRRAAAASQIMAAAIGFLNMAIGTITLAAIAFPLTGEWLDRAGPGIAAGVVAAAVGAYLAAIAATRPVIVPTVSASGDKPSVDAGQGRGGRRLSGINVSAAPQQ